MVCGDRAERDGGKLCLRAVGTGNQHDGYLSADDDAGIFCAAENAHGLTHGVADLIVRHEQDIRLSRAGNVVVLVAAGLLADGEVETGP